MVDLPQAILIVLICFELRIWKFGRAEGSDGINRSVSFQCTNNSIAIFVTKKHLPSFNHSSFHLYDDSCKGELNHSHIILQTKLNECGTIERRFNGSHIFTNVVHGYLKNSGNPSSKNIAMNFAVECSKPWGINRTTAQLEITGTHDMNKTANVQDVPLQLIQLSPAENRTRFSPLTFKAVNSKIVNFGEEVSFTAELSTNNGMLGSVNKSVAVDVCRVTPDDNFDSEEGVTLIEDGCVKKPMLCGYMFESESTSQTVSYKMSSSSHEKRRTFYLNCRLVLCPIGDQQSLCRVGCRPGYNKKIERETNNTIMLRVGPLTLNEKPLKAQVKTGQRGILKVKSLVSVPVGVVSFLLVAVSILIFYCRRRRRLKRRDTLLDNEERFSDIERSFDQDDDVAVFEETSAAPESQLSDETDICRILEKRKLFLNMDWTVV